MNRKSSAFALRKSIRPRDSQVPSAGVPGSARRGFANRSTLDVTRSSVGGGRVSIYGQANPKDGRHFNDDFIHKTFGRIRDFLVQKSLGSDIVPTSNKLTLRQFEHMFVTLYRFIDPAYKPPSGNHWVEQEVPVLVDNYPHKVTKSMMQTVSSKPGPVVGILDYLIDLVLALECDPADAVRLLAKDEDALQMDCDELARTSFKNVPAASSPQLKEQVLDLCSRHKGIMDEDVIRAELEQVQADRRDVEARLQLMEEQLAERDNIEAEYQDMVAYFEQINGRKATKEQELERLIGEKAQVAENASEIERLITKTRNVIDSQPISFEEIRSIRTQISGLEADRDSLLVKKRETEAELKAAAGSVRVAEATIETICGEVVVLLENVPQLEERISHERLIQITKKPADLASLTDNLLQLANQLDKKIAERRLSEEEQMFELSQQIKQKQTTADFVKQDKDTIEEKLVYFSSRLTDKLEELLNRRRAVSGYSNQIVFLEKEIEDLKVELTRLQGQATAAEAKVEKHRTEFSAALFMFEMERQRIDSSIEADVSRMKKTIAFYRDQFAALPLEQIASMIMEKVKVESIARFVQKASRSGDS